MIRRFGPPPLAGQHYRRRPGAYALLIRDRRILLTFQQSPATEFQLPGGGIDPGEAPLQALYREVAEETGWCIAAPRLIGTYRRFCFMPDYGYFAEKICSIWLARPIRQLGPPTEPGHSAHWLDLQCAADLLLDSGSRHMLLRGIRAAAGSAPLLRAGAPGNLSLRDPFQGAEARS